LTRYSKIGVAIVIALFSILIMSSSLLAQNQWTKYDPDGDGRPDPVMEPGPGDWEAHRVYYPRIILDNGIYKMYYTGQTDGNTSRFGYATSVNGIDWDKHVDESPIMYPGDSWDRHNIHVPTVILDSAETDLNKRYKMWYQGDDWTVYRIGYATSNDGIHWGNRQLVLPSPGEPGYASPGNVIIDGGQYVMYYCFQSSPVPTTTWRATSTDGINWVNRQQVLSFGAPDEWDAREAYNPYVEKNAGLYHMWYFGHKAGIGGIGYATSLNGIDWVKNPKNPVVSRGNAGDFDEINVDSPSVRVEGSKLRMWYHGAYWVGSSYRTVILYATDESPIAEDDDIEIDADVPSTIDILANDIDPDHTDLCIIKLAQPQYGTLTYADGDNAGQEPDYGNVIPFYSGRFIYTPNADFPGADTFTYVVSDYVGGTDEGTVNITLNEVTAQINIDPDTLNLKDNGNYITCYIQLPDGYNVEDIDISSIKLEDTLTVEHGNIQDGILMVKFSRKDLIDYIKTLGLTYPEYVTLEVTGELAGGTTFCGSDTIKVINPGKGKKAPAEAEFALLSAYPQPFNPEVWIPYKLGDNVQVKFSIYNAGGSLVRTLNLGYKQSGSYVSKDKSAYWDGRNEAGEQVSSGVYFYTIQAGNYTATGKMIMQK